MLSLKTDALAMPKAQSHLFDATFELVSTALVLLDGQGMVLKINGAFGELLGYAAAELVGKPLLDILHPADRESLQARHDWTLPGCLAGSPLELHYLRKDGRLLRGRSKLAVVGIHLDSASLLLGEIIALDATPSVDQQLEQDQRLQRIVGMPRDIAERKRDEDILYAREQEFRALVESSPDLIARFDLYGRFIYANPASQRIFGCSLTELLGKNSGEASPHSNAARSFQGKIEQIVRTGKATEDEFALDAPPARRAAVPACYQIRLVPERDQCGQLVSILAVGRNISNMRAAERCLKETHAQLHQMTSCLETSREEERKRIAREIHDELGQQLTALRMGISLLRLQFGKDHPLLAERVQALTVRVDETIQVVRNVATSLRPSALDMGLTSALEWLVSEFSQHSGIPCRLTAPPSRLKLDDEHATAVFRVIQESLTNVARHARASQVEVKLERNYEHVSIEVSDDGKGFDPEQPYAGRLGLVGMCERGHMLGGVVTIDSAPGRGTRVQVHIPFQAAPEEP